VSDQTTNGVATMWCEHGISEEVWCRDCGPERHAKFAARHFMHALSDQELSVEVKRRGWRSSLSMAPDDDLLDEVRRRKLWVTHANGLPIATDEQLRAECERRGWYMGAALMSDADMIAECERRWPLGTVDERRALSARNQLLREVEAVVPKEEREHAASWVSKLMADRDEWKRLAEAAEKRAAWCQRCTGTGELGYGGPDCPACDGTGTFSLLRARLALPETAAAVAAARERLDRADESGPGIAATKPDDDGQWGATLEDLLADDAP
jgi:hypothetical protein